MDDGNDDSGGDGNDDVHGDGDGDEGDARMTTLTIMAPSLMMAAAMFRGVGRSSTCARARGPRGII